MRGRWDPELGPQKGTQATAGVWGVTRPRGKAGKPQTGLSSSGRRNCRTLLLSPGPWEQSQVVTQLARGRGHRPLSQSPSQKAGLGLRDNS